MTSMAVSILLGLTWLLVARPSPFSDYLDYYQLATGILDEHQFGYPLATARRLPGYPALLALAMLISRSVIWLGVLNLALTAAILPVIHRFVLHLSGDRRAALIAAAVCAVNPTFVYFSPIIASEHLFALLFYISFLPLFSSRLGPLVRAGSCGVLLGAAVLTRGEALFYLPLPLFLAWITTSGPKRDRAVAAAVVLVACAVVIAPWAIRNRVVMGPGVVLSTVSGVNLYYGHNSTTYGYHDLNEEPFFTDNEIELQRRTFNRALGYLETKPSRLFDDIAMGTPLLLWDSGAYSVRAGLIHRKSEPPYTIRVRRKYPTGSLHLIEWAYRLVLLFVIAAPLAYRRIGPAGMLLPYGIIALNWVCYAVVFWSKPRFRYTAEIAMCILMAFALTWLWDIVTRWRHARAGTGDATT
jgi:4-amino-4-deoxy-L-arabinose transferase-like glycosyltransferase